MRKRLTLGDIGPGWILLGLIVLLIFVWRPLCSVFTDYLWFQSLQYGSVFRRSLALRWLCALASGGFVFTVLYVNGLVAGKYKPAVRRLARGRFAQFMQFAEVVASLQRSLNRVVLGVSIAGALFAAGLADEQWERTALFLFAMPFGRTDPAYHKDIGFYLFRLPLLDSIWGGVFWTLLAGAGLSFGVYALRAAFEAFAKEDQFPPYVKAHLTILAVILLVWKALGFWLDQLHLLYSRFVRVPDLGYLAAGAGYADSVLRRPLFIVLSFLCIACAGFLVLNLRRAAIRPAIHTIGGIIVISLLVNFVVPPVAQLFIRGNEQTLEQPYLSRSIQMTRFGYGIEQIRRKDMEPAAMDVADISRLDPATMRNIRIWDHRALIKTIQQQQQIRSYYRVINVDSDRYRVNDEYRQVAVCARELSPDDIPQQSWVNLHQQYTHGYGAVVASASEATPEGKPLYLLSDIPPHGQRELQSEENRVYFGERPIDGSELPYALVNLRTPEIDYSIESGTVKNRFNARTGIAIDSLVSRLAFAAILPKGWYLLTTREIQRGSQLLWRRSIQERVEMLAPFLRFDDDPYLVVTAKSLFWIVDGYTTSDYLPYSQPDRIRVAPSGDDNPLYRANYMRNSVKVTINAATGETRFYIADPSDPVIRTWSRAFPTLFQSLDRMPGTLREHLRYPIDLFRSQANIYSFYHMEDPVDFYKLEDRWELASEIISNDTKPQQMEPYYATMRLPGAKNPEFILMIPFEPYRKKVMIGWLAARCDGNKRGELFAFHFPKGAQVYGPMQIEADINTDPHISGRFTLWDQGGSRVLRGHLLVLPMEQTLLYVKPIYLEATQTQIPELKMVVTAHGTTPKPQYGDTLAESLAKDFGEAVYALLEGKSIPPAVARSSAIRTGPGVPTRLKTDLASLAEQAQSLYERAQASGRKGDWKSFGEDMKELGSVLQTIQKVTRRERSEQRAALP